MSHPHIKYMQRQSSTDRWDGDEYCIYKIVTNSDGRNFRLVSNIIPKKSPLDGAQEGGTMWGGNKKRDCFTTGQEGEASPERGKG